MTVVTKLSIEYHQFLDENGQVKQDLPDFARNPENLIEMYKLMVLMRIFDSKAVALQRTGKMGTYAGITGQEAISVAIGKAMRADDALCPSYREYGALIQRGTKMADIFTYWGGDERGSNFNNPNDMPICVPIATQCLHAAGIAVAMKLRKQDRVAVTVVGDGGTSRGDFYEAMNLAGDWQLPVVFVINNNQWAISVPRNKQSSTKTLAQKGFAAGLACSQVDGNDIIAVRDAVETALAKARDGGGPSVVECITYRLCDHTTADDAKRYRPDAEVENAWKKEPIPRLRTYLMNINAWSNEQEEKLKQKCAADVDAAVQEYMRMPPQPPEAIFDYLYAKLPESLEEQRNLLLEEETHG